MSIHIVKQNGHELYRTHDFWAALSMAMDIIGTKETAHDYTINKAESVDEKLTTYFKHQGKGLK
jgi:hypothetical protein